MANTSSPSPDVQQLAAAYQTLDLDLQASPLVIRTRYRELAQIHHPDKWMPGSIEQQAAAERMREINAAYDLIEDAPLQARSMPDEQQGPLAQEPRAPRRYQRHWLTDSDLLESCFRGLFGLFLGASFAYWLREKAILKNQLYLWLVPAVTGLVFARASSSMIRALENTMWILRMLGR